MAQLNPPSAESKSTSVTATTRSSRGLTFRRHFSSAERAPFDEIVWERRQSAITNPDGSIVFKMTGAEIPSAWSQLATDIVVSKYFRKAGVGEDKSHGETSVRQVVTRIVNTLRKAGEKQGGYVATSEDARVFE